MAGESPDRSKQRESSAEPTPGSAGPVPGAGSEPEGSAEKRDPRLTVSRDAVSPSTPSESSASTEGSAGGVDTATRVLSVRDAQTDEQEDREDEEAPDSAESDSGAEEAAPDGRDDSATDGDGRLQAVVASWVRSADEAEQTEQDGTGKGAESARKAADADGDGTDGTDDQSAQEARDGGESLDEGSGEASEGDGADASDAEADGESRTGVTPEADADAAPVVARTADVPDAEEDDTPAADGDGDGGDTDAEAAPEAAKAAPGAGADKASGTDDVDTESTAGADETDADETDAGDADETAPGAPRTDQPTAVFKAPRPSAPAVDQPTTMLKLGEAAEGTGKATDKAAETDPEPVPESAAERTSKFVPLKDLDDPEVRKAPSVGDSVTTALRVPPSASPAPASPVTSPAAGTRSVPQVGPELTRQQPLPPKPPLDLLAELTNTPPPPETPLRTAVRRVKIWTPLVVLLAIVFATVQAVRPLPQPTLTLTATGSHTFAGDQVQLDWPDQGQGWMDANGLGTMDHFGEQKPVPIGSVAKTMTAYVILKNHPLKPGQEGPGIPVDATAEKEGGLDETDDESTLNTIKEGDTLTLKQALSALMVPSANNVARLLARWDAGSEEAFVEKMNDAAKQLGMKNTTYTDPSGLEATTVSTAEDQVKLGNEVVDMPALMEITKLPEWIDPTGKKHRNWNTLVPFDGAIGIKTGTTTKAGGNLLFAGTKDVDGETATVVGAILGQWGPSIIDVVNAVSKTALLSAQDALTSETILKKGDVVGHVDDRLGGRTPVVVSEDVKAIGWSGSKVELSLKADDIPHTASAGTKVGTLTVGDGTEGAVEVPVQLQSALAEPGFGAKVTRVG